MELLHRNLSGFAVFAVESESEAPAMLARATAAMYELPPRAAGYSNPALARPAETAGRSVDSVNSQCILGILDFMVEEFPYAADRVGASS